MLKNEKPIRQIRTDPDAQCSEALTLRYEHKLKKQQQHD